MNGRSPNAGLLTSDGDIRSAPSMAFLKRAKEHKGDKRVLGDMSLSPPKVRRQTRGPHESRLP